MKDNVDCFIEVIKVEKAPIKNYDKIKGFFFFLLIFELKNQKS